MKPPVSPTAVFNSFTSAFPEEGMVDGKGARVNPGIDTKRDRLIREAYRRANKQGWDKATVVSVLTFPLDLNIGYGGHLTMPGKKVGAAYITKVFDTPHIDPQDEGDGKIVPILVFPTELAEDLVREYAPTGGVFWYIGDQPLDQYEGEGLLARGESLGHGTGLELLNLAQNNVLTWYEMLYQEAQDQWTRSPQHRNITDRMRDAAKELFRLGIISELPAWTKVNKEESPNTNCDGCGQVVAKVAKFCPTCNTMFDVEWVKSHRADIWLAQNTSVVERFIKEEKDKLAAANKLIKDQG